MRKWMLALALVISFGIGVFGSISHEGHLTAYENGVGG